MASKSNQTRTVIQGLHTDRGIRYKIRNRHPIPADFDGVPLDAATRRLERLGVDGEVTRFDDGRAAVHFKLWPTVGLQSAISLRGREKSVVDAFRLYLPKSLVPEGEHKEAVESVGEIVERADPPTYVDVSIPIPGEPHPGVPHVLFDPDETAPSQNRKLPVHHMAEFMNDLKRIVSGEL